MKNFHPAVVDLHSDLLAYLVLDDKRTPNDRISRSSYPDLIAGNVKLQTLAVSAITSPTGLFYGIKQVDAFKQLLEKYPQQFKKFSRKEPLPDASTNQVCIIPAFENASAFSSEEEPLDESLTRLATTIDAIGPFFYMSLTWNGENRFGGGVGSEKGLKADGKILLEWLNNRGIAIDLSHASDKLAWEILEFIDKKGLKLSIIASHSNYRAVKSMARNLPDELVQQIIQRKGLIGLNFFAPFVDDHESKGLLKHIEYALNLGAENVLCFGADFFCIDDFPELQTKYEIKHRFFPELANSSCYPTIFQQLETDLGVSREIISKIASANAMRFLHA